MTDRAPLGDSGTDGKEARMNGTIVCGVDGSTGSRAALVAASQLAGRLGARLVVALVVDNPPDPAAAFGGMYAGGFAMPPITPAMSDEIEKAGLHLLERMTDDAGLTDAECTVVVGAPAPERLAYLADEEGADFIVVGSRGRGPFKAAFLGSVSTALVSVARCPVLIVPPDATEAPKRAA
jgi:nucleotide-binding universal stress UspA family protein